MRIAFLCLLLLINPITNLQAASATYKYDATGKLLEIEYDDKTKVTYTYDIQGNMISSTSTKIDSIDLAWLNIVTDLLLD